MSSLPVEDGNVSLVIPQERMASLRESLGSLKAEMGVEAALLVDNAGRLIAQEGKPPGLDSLTVAALAAGNLATLRALARKLNETRFSLIFQRKTELSVYLQAVGEHALLIVLFSEGAPLGVVRLRVRSALAALERELASCSLREEKLGEDQAPAAGFRPAPPALLRRIWRIKQLIEDSRRAAVGTKAPTLWREAEGQVRMLAELRGKGEFVLAEGAAVKAEAILMRGLERALDLEGPEAEQRDWARIGFFMDLMAVTGMIYRDWLSDKAPAALDNVDREIRQKYPAALADWRKGRLEKTAMERFLSATGDTGRLTLLRAFLALLVNRAWVVDKIFGPDASQQLLESWQQILHDRWSDVQRLDLGKPMHWLTTQARRPQGLQGASK